MSNQNDQTQKLVPTQKNTDDFHVRYKPSVPTQQDQAGNEKTKKE